MWTRLELLTHRSDYISQYIYSKHSRFYHSTAFMIVFTKHNKQCSEDSMAIIAQTSRRKSERKNVRDCEGMPSVSANRRLSAVRMLTDNHQQPYKTKCLQYISINLHVSFKFSHTVSKLGGGGKSTTLTSSVILSPPMQFELRKKCC